MNNHSLLLHWANTTPPLFSITQPSLEWLISPGICWECSPLVSLSPSGCCLLHAHHLHTFTSRWSSTPASCFNTGPRFHLCQSVVRPVPELSGVFRIPVPNSSSVWFLQIVHSEADLCRSACSDDTAQFLNLVLCGIHLPHLQERLICSYLLDPVCVCRS